MDSKQSYQIISDGSCDLPSEVVKEKNIKVVPFYVSFDDENYNKEIEEISIRDFYSQMVEKKGVYPKSSMPSTQDYIDAFDSYVKDGIKIICICITTKFSGSMASALNAKNMILEMYPEYPEKNITIIDATINTVLQGLYVLEAVKLRDRGVSYEESVTILEDIKSTGRIFFTVGDMEYLQHGGRIGKVAGVAVKLLGIRPIITLKQGEIFPAGIGRSRKKTMDRTVDLLIAYLKENEASLQEYSIAVGFGYDREEAEQYREKVMKILSEHHYKVTKEDLPIYQIGATIGVHTGPYPIGLGIIKRA